MEHWRWTARHRIARVQQELPAGSLGRTGESRMAQPGATGRWRRKVVTYGYGEMRRCQAAHASTSARELNHWTETARYSVTRYRPRNSSTKSSRLHRLLRGGTNSTAKKWRQRPGSVAMKCGTHQNAWLRRTAMGCSANARHQNHIATSQQFSRSRFRTTAGYVVEFPLMSLSCAQ